MLGRGPPRLGWLVPGPLDQPTGGYLYDARMVGGLRARGWRVEVVDLGLRWWPVDVRGTVRLVRAVAGRGWDLVVVDELAHPAMALGLPLARARLAQPCSGTTRRARPPVIALVHHLRCSEPASPPVRAVAALAERAALATADAVVCTSATTAATIRAVAPPGVRIEAIRPGRDLPEGPPERPALAMSGTPDSGRGLRVLTVGHWTPRKGIVEALRAVALTTGEVSLDLVGDPRRDHAYARLVRAELDKPALAGRVRVHGRVSSERLRALYRQADALLLASRHEGYGMVLAEAMMAGLPIVATRVGAVPEVVGDAAGGELVGVGDVAGLARALQRLARDPAERRRLAALALERAASLPTWEESCAQFADVLEQLLARGASNGAGVRGGV